MSKVCVFGGKGFIGNYVENKLMELGHEVVIIGNSEKHEKNYYTWSSLNNRALDNIFFDVDSVIDLAYSTTPKTSFDEPIADIRDNLPFAINLFELLSRYPIKKLVLVSTGGAIYGNTNESPISENAETNPISPYGITKLAVEKYSMMYYAHRSLPVVCVRPGNAYGSGQTPFTGQGFVSTAIYSILQKKAVSIYGKEGTVRDYIHVEDVAKGILAALNKGKIGEVYNIGTGIGKSNLDIFTSLQDLAKASHLRATLNVLPERPYDVKKNILDFSKLQKDTGWYPEILFEDGLEKMWKQAWKEVNQINKVVW